MMIVYVDVLPFYPVIIHTFLCIFLFVDGFSTGWARGYNMGWKDGYQDSGCGGSQTSRPPTGST